MSSNNGASGLLGVILVLAFIVAAAWALLIAMMYVFIAVFAFLTFIAFAWTIVCALAWRHSFRLGRIVVYPDDARAFIVRGVFGAFVLPLFLAFAQTVLDVPVNWNHAAYYVTIGYTLFSIGLEYLFAASGSVPYVDQGYAPPPTTLDLPASSQRLLPSQPYRFATWDDEENRS